MKKTKRVLSIIMSVLIMLSVLPITIVSATAATSETVFAGGDGTAENPYQVYDVEGLKAINNDLSAHYIQVADIDLGNENWIAIGGNSSAFTGNYNGNSCTIKNLTYKDQRGNDGGFTIALFGCNEGTICNVKIENIQIDVYSPTVFAPSASGSYDFYNALIGGIAGENSGRIENCEITSGNIVTRDDPRVRDDWNGFIYSGGICGENAGEIYKCINLADISIYGSQYAIAGGICGSNNRNVLYSLNSGDISASCPGRVVPRGLSRCHAAGIAGFGGGCVTNCISMAKNISATMQSGPWANDLISAYFINDGASENCYALEDACVRVNNAPSFHDPEYVTSEIGVTLTDIDTLFRIWNALLEEINPPPVYSSSKELYFSSPVAIMNIGETRQLVVHSRDVSYVNGEPVYSNDKILNSSELVWDGYYDDNGIIKMSDGGQVTALKEGIEYILVHSKNDINLGTSCRVFVGNPNEFNYTASYDTKQYYAEGGFFSEISSVSDCVEIYMLLENKLADELKDLTSIGGDPYGEEARAKFKDIAPITLTATVNGNGLSFDRDSDVKTYTVMFDKLSVGKAVDDVLMLFPRNINIAPSGNTYTVTVTLKSDSFETITEQYTFTVEDLETKNANEHIAFVSQNPDYLISKKNFYGETMGTLKNDAEYKWSKFSTFDFENYYQITLADIMIKMLDANQVELPSLVPAFIKDWVGTYKTLLNGITTIVDDKYASKAKIDKWIKASKYETDGIHADDELYQTVLDLLGNAGNAEKITKIFATVDKTKQVFGFVKLGTNIFKDAVEWGNKISLYNTYANADEKFKQVMKTFAETIPDSERGLKEAVNDYVNYSSDKGGQVQEVLESFAGMFKNVTLDIFKSATGKGVIQYELAQLATYVGDIKLIGGMTLSATTMFGSVTTGISLGLCLSDVLCDSSGKAEEMSKVVAMSEFSPYVIATLNKYESKLYADRNNEAVDTYEYAFALHKATQSYIMEHTVKALETKRDSLIIKLFSRDDYDGLIADVLAQKSVIDNLECHNSNGESTVVTKTKVVAIKCPVDVFVYDEKGQEVVKIKNDLIEYIATGINYFVEGGEKYLALPADQNYSIKIIATDDGSMEYTVTEYGNGGNRLKTVRKATIELLDGRVFTGDIVEKMDASPESYALQYDENVLSPDSTITIPVTGVTIDRQNIELKIGESDTLTATITPTNASINSLSWTSDNPNVATVDKNGNVKAIARGVANVTVSTNDWGYTDTCIVTVSDSHEHTDADGKWETDGNAHWHTCECGIQFDKVEHSGGEATCNSKAVCDVCKNEYGEFNADNHKGTTYVKDQKEATCYEEGYTGDTYCSDCRTKIETGSTIPKNAHNPASVWSTNDTHHWKECQTVGCGNIIDQAEHSGGEATCKSRAICATCGVEYGGLNAENHTGETELKDVTDPTCTVDGYTGNTYCKDCGVILEEGDVIPASHTLQQVEAKAATHDADGNIEYYVCTVCGAYFADAAAEREIAYDDTVIAKGEHNYVTRYDDENHWQECDCGIKTEPEAHIFGEWVITKEATVSEKGIREKACSICGYKITEEIPVISESGSGNTGTTGGSLVDSKPSNDGKPNNAQTSSPQTGDNSSMMLWVVLFAISGTALTSMVRYKRKRLK